MLKERIDEVNTSFGKIYNTSAGTLYLRRQCSPLLVESLHIDDGLRSFARLPEREYELLLKLARQPSTSLTLAYTATSKIVGQATIAPADDWWVGVGNAYEISVEVSSCWRTKGIAQQLLAFALEDKAWEQALILGLGFSWHWDYEGLNMTRFEYRKMIDRLFSKYGFAEYQTSEPNIQMDPANILMARFGKQFGAEGTRQFFQRLFHSESFPGL
jgi:acetoin utilization protein AcuA